MNVDSSYLETTDTDKYFSYFKYIINHNCYQYIVAHWAFAIKYLTASGSGTEVEHLTHFPKGKCSNTAYGGKRREGVDVQHLKIQIFTSFIEIGKFVYVKATRVW